jgi:hypothetical protein
MAITSETDIGNLALDLLSAGTVQDIVTPTSPTEELLNRWYDQVRQTILRAHPWNFASKRAVIAASGTAPDFGFSAAFPVPNDFLRLLSIQDADGNDIQAPNFRMEFVGNQRCILFNSEAGALRLRYVFDITDVSKFDPLFVTLFAHELAIAIAYKVTESNGNVERVAALIKQAGSLARSIDGQESPPIMIQRSKSLDARRNLYGIRRDRIQF